MSVKIDQAGTEILPAEVTNIRPGSRAQRLTDRRDLAVLDPYVEDAVDVLRRIDHVRIAQDQVKVVVHLIRHKSVASSARRRARRDEVALSAAPSLSPKT